MSEATRIYQITVEGQDCQIACRSDQTLLEALEKNRSELVCIGCRCAGCGVCKVQLTRGEVRLKKMSRDHVSVEEEAAGYLLACCAMPLGDVRLRLLSG
jgi:ferredoxin